MRCAARIGLCVLVVALYATTRLFSSEQRDIQRLTERNQRLAQDLQRVSGELAVAQQANVATRHSAPKERDHPPDQRQQPDLTDPPSEQQPQCSTYANMDLPGWDLTDVELSAPSVLQKCCNACTLANEYATALVFDWPDCCCCSVRIERPVMRRMWLTLYVRCCHIVDAVPLCYVEPGVG